MAFCDIKSSWSSDSDERPLGEVVVYHTDDAEDSISTSWADGLSLHCPTTRCPCSIIITRCKPHLAISAIDIICDARHAELFLDHGQYHTTMLGVSVSDDLDLDRPLYMLQHSFSKPVSACTIRLVSLTEENTLWIKGLYITMESVNCSTNATALAQMTSNIDLEKVRVLLNGTEGLSDKAKKLFQSMEMFQQNKEAAVGAMFGNPLAFGGHLAEMMSKFSAMNTADAKTGLEEAGEIRNSETRSPNLTESVADGGSSESNFNGCCSLLNSETVSLNNEEDSVSTSKTSEKCSKCGYGISDTGTPILSNPTGMFMIAERLQDHVNKTIKDTELRILTDIHQKISDMEKKLEAKLDKILLEMHGNNTKCDPSD